MHTGMLWFDNSKKMPLDEKIREAVRYYRHKYERIPELCLINSLDQHDNPDLTCVEVDGQMVAVRPWKNAAAGHMWIGVEEAPS